MCLMSTSVVHSISSRRLPSGAAKERVLVQRGGALLHQGTQTLPLKRTGEQVRSGFRQGLLETIVLLLEDS